MKTTSASVRADGTVRKERKIRPGYAPPEEVSPYVPPARRQAMSGEGTTESVLTKQLADISPEDYHLYHYHLVDEHYEIVRDKAITLDSQFATLSIKGEAGKDKVPNH